MPSLSPLLLLGLAPVTLGAASMLTPAPILLINRSQSEPPGIWIRSAKPARPGRRIAFRIPQPGRAYAAKAMPERLRSSILKTVIAGEGDQVCALKRRLVVNGRDLAPIANHDRHGAALPRWRGCRALRGGEYFVFSSRIPNSFDSRYYGPVSSDDVMGVYRPLRLSSGAPGGEGGV
jgi:conjugative transfer signal peptidase TraF